MRIQLSLKQKLMMMKRHNLLNKIHYLGILIVLISLSASAQSDKPDPAILEAQDFVADGNEAFVSKEFTSAETAYRKAVAKNPANATAKYNMGNNYYRNKKYAEGMTRYIQAAEVAQTKAEKHKAFHNLGNAFYQQKDYKKAVEAYKNALRNDPTDEETRYNLALAKKEEEKNGGGGGDDQKDDNKDKGDDQKDKNGDGDDEKSDDGKPKDSDDEGDKKDKGDENKDEKGKPEDKEGDKPKDGKDGDKPKEQPQPQPGQGQLSPQQVKSLLEAMKNEENKVQDKMNAQKVKGAKVKTDKDW
ncbi:tetratricopeptide repeat protein [Leeuwenhoekiella sp. MAR_2009_132]|uniref:tetratricopeptide repeat protein n=1 Tax=Leeuwenhoekiella sp. MAR_2009_132 TaxID=1392489 RepID=UPI001F4235EC|nr:tetratricopeptide repeat protein [Leeuwenhoekiella sp. MAR_2009_132]